MQRFAVYHFVTLMQDLDKLHEIEELGLEDREDAPPEEPEGGNSSMVPLLQGVICLLILAALLLLRYMGSPVYETFTQWYQQEVSEEVQLPAWEETTPSPSPSASPEASPAPIETDASLQRV